MNMHAQRRLADLSLIALAAIAASFVIATSYRDPWLSTFAIAILLLLLLARFHDTRDIVGLLVGATLGNAIELASDAAGIWMHADRSVLGLAPPYILLCYPILGFAVPRMVEALAGSPQSIFDRIGVVFPAAFAILLSFVALSVTLAHRPAAHTLMCTLILAITLSRFHSRHDVIAAAAGAFVALTWEIPATVYGAWQFPVADVFGLIPAWLPAAYAVFFVSMGRITAVLANETETAIDAWRRTQWTRERRRDLTVVSTLIAGAVAGVCLFFRFPIVCAAASALVLFTGLYRWHTRADAAIAITGAIFGPILEYFATGSTLWIYPHTTIGLLPAWVFTLWPAFPLCLVRLTHTLWPPHDGDDRNPVLGAAVGLSILIIEIPLLATFGNTRPLFTAGVTTAMLFIAAGTLRSPQAVLMLTLSGVFGMLCELLPIALGAWIYPLEGPLPFPLWLPTGYALFGFGIVQLAQGAEGMVSHVVTRRVRAFGAAAAERHAKMNQRRPEHAVAGR